MRRVVGHWLAIAWIGFAVLPWNAIGGSGFFSFNWIAQYPTGVAAAIGGAVAMVGLFTVYPLARLFEHAFLDSAGHWSLAALINRVAATKIWSYDGIVWNTLQLGLMTATAATLLALCLVLIVTRSTMKGRRLLSVLSVL